MIFNRVETPLTYSTDAEYRSVLREWFQMNCEGLRETFSKEDWDEITLDEMLFDNTNVLNILDTIYEKTSDHSFFYELYEKAAGFFLSTDATLGVTVLCSYDYFRWFYPTLRDYFLLESTGAHIEKKQSAIELQKIIMR